MSRRRVLTLLTAALVAALVVAWGVGRGPGSTPRRVADALAGAAAEDVPTEEVVLRVEGVAPIRMLLDTRDQVITRMMESGHWEETETRWFRRSIRPGDVVVDVGANVGYYTLLGARLVGETGRVYAFEPDPTSFALLRRNVALNDLHNVVLEQKAVSDAPGRLRLFLASENKGDHRIYQPPGEQRPSVEVEAVTLDGYFREHPESVDLVKVDTQGAELLILRGMQDLVRRADSLVMVFEYSPMHLAGLGSQGHELLGLFEALGLDLFDLGMGQPMPDRLRRANTSEMLKTFSPQSPLFTNLLLLKGRPDLLALMEQPVPVPVFTPRAAQRAESR